MPVCDGRQQKKTFLGGTSGDPGREAPVAQQLMRLIKAVMLVYKVRIILYMTTYKCLRRKTQIAIMDNSR